MSSEHIATYSATIREGEKHVGVATLRHLANEHYILRIAYDGKKFIVLHIDDKRVLYRGERSDGDSPLESKTQRELVRLSIVARSILRRLNTNPDGNDPKFIEFTQDLEARLTDPEKSVKFHNN